MNEKTIVEAISAQQPQETLERIVEEGEYLDHLKKINDVFYDQIKIADQKAAYLFTFMIAFLVTSTDGRAVFDLQRYASGHYLLAIASAIMAVGTVFTLVAAILVVLPRRAANGTSLYWGSWSTNRLRFLEAHRDNVPDFLTAEYLGNVDNLSLIAARKFRFVGIAFWSLLVTALAYVCVLAVKNLG